MKRIGILRHSKIPASEQMAIEIKEWLTAREIDAWIDDNWATDEIQTPVTDASLLVVLGGDGSLLRATRLAVPYKLPVFGINMGRIGFLSEAQPDDWQQRLNQVLSGDYWVEKRLLVQATLQRAGQVVEVFTALNDVVIGRGAQARVLRLQLWVDGDLVTLYTADALIVATPTGSTAYSMAAGGPLLPPQLQNFVVVPVAAHLSLDRALVLHEEAEITIQVQMDHEATLTADGQEGVSLQDGDKITFKKHQDYAYFARVDTSGYFYRRLMQRLGYMGHK